MPLDLSTLSLSAIKERRAAMDDAITVIQSLNHGIIPTEEKLVTRIFEHLAQIRAELATRAMQASPVGGDSKPPSKGPPVTPEDIAILMTQTPAIQETNP